MPHRAIISSLNKKFIKKTKGERKRERPTCRPTLIFLVRAACGKTACTCGTADDDTVPPSGPTAWTSCLMRDTTAK